MIKKDDLDKLATKLGPLFIIIIFLIVFRLMTFIVHAATSLVQQSYRVGYSFGSLIEKLF